MSDPQASVSADYGDDCTPQVHEVSTMKDARLPLAKPRRLTAVDLVLPISCVTDA